MRPAPVGIPKTAAPQYERELRRGIIDPVRARIQATLSELPEGNVPLETIRARLASDILGAVADLDGLARAAATGHVLRVARWHRRRLLATFRKHGLDLEPWMAEDVVREALRARIADNVRLVKTIPPRMHDSMMRRLAKLAEGGWRFDPDMLKRVLQAEYGSTGYNLRRLTRDQTTKQLGQLTQIRHTQSGIMRYQWFTQGDRRVRDTHAENDGQIYRWAAPPSTGHPGHAIQCRCNAAPHIEDADIARLTRRP